MKKYKVFNGYYFSEEDDFDQEKGFDTIEEAKKEACKLAKRHQGDYVVVEAKCKVGPETKDIKIVEEEIV